MPTTDDITKRVAEIRARAEQGDFGNPLAAGALALDALWLCDTVTDLTKLVVKITENLDAHRQRITELETALREIVTRADANDNLLWCSGCQAYVEPKRGMCYDEWCDECATDLSYASVSDGFDVIAKRALEG